MISRSVNKRAEFVFVPRMAGRSTPMTGIPRPNLSYRTLLLFFILLGTPMAARSGTLEDSARDLARKIAAALTTRGEMSCEIRNVSSLELDEVVRIEQALKTELQGQCVRAQANGGETANLVVTLSENVKNLVWTAEIHQGAEHHEILQVVPRSAAPPSSAKPLPIALSSERFWDGPERILDAGYAGAPNGDRLLVLLLSDAVLIRNVNKVSENRIDIPLAISISALRDPPGNLSLQVGNLIAAMQGRRNCTVSLVTYALVKCEDDQGEMTGFVGPPVKAGQVVSAPSNCTQGGGVPWFVTGTGDDTQPDSLQIVVWQNLGSAIASNQVTFPGPILAIHGALSDASTTVIVKNLRTGNYEAYRLSISCGQ